MDIISKEKFIEYLESLVKKWAEECIKDDVGFKEDMVNEVKFKFKEFGEQR